MPVTITLDTARFRAGMNDFTRRQYPFALAQSMTDVLYDARDEAKAELPSRFTIRSTWVAKGFRVERATKDRLVATLWHKDEFMGLQESGGVKRPKAGKSVGIPHGDRFAGARKTLAGKTTRAKWPGNIKRRVFIRDKSDPSTTYEFQRSGSRSGGKVRKHHIDRRFGPRQKDPKLKLMYVLKKSVRVTPRLDMSKTAIKVARFKMHQHFKRRMEGALRTAK